jgi:hypothetical protein
MVITDGEENSSGPEWNEKIGKLFRELHASDRWTIVFRVPKGYAKALIQKGIPEGNIEEWEQTQAGFEAATAANTQAISSYYMSRAAGAKSTSTFYSDLRSVRPEEVRATMTDITAECDFYKVTDATKNISEFVKENTGRYLLGSVFYQLVKTESAVQYDKIICIRNKSDGKVYSGQSARTMLGLAGQGKVRLAPGDHGQYDIFIQSKSTNRKLPLNTEVMVWLNVRQM